MQHYNVFLERRAFRQLKNIKGDMYKRIVETLHILRDEGFSKKLDVIKTIIGYCLSWNRITQ
ncbi:MAG: hypothetical protein QXL89_08540 [Nitrososphaeria archaeon]